MQRIIKIPVLVTILSIAVLTVLSCSGIGEKEVESKGIGATQYTTTPQQVLPDGSYVYYVISSGFRTRGNDITTSLDIKSPKGYVEVEDIEKNLTVTVNSDYEGTALIVRHFSNDIFDISDKAVLVVRTEEQKKLWEDAITKEVRKNKGKYEDSMKPRDVLP